MFKSYFLVGGAGFIGSHFVDALLKQEHVQKVAIYDNFSYGREWHYAHHQQDTRLCVIRGDVKDPQLLTQSMAGYDVVMHLASNADISQSAINPSLDFTDGMALTFQVLESARKAQVKRIIYTSGSGVYGEVGEQVSREDQGGLQPISLYGASKLAGEAFISGYCHMFGLSACVFRFANVVGPRQTHGVSYDFIRSLINNSASLRILGDGKQSKSYIHISDIVQAVLLVNEKMQSGYETYNVATSDAITVRQIADIIVQCLALKNPVTFTYTGGDRGWNGDVPVVRLNTDKIRALGWRCQHDSAQSIRMSALALIEEVKQELLGEGS